MRKKIFYIILIILILALIAAIFYFFYIKKMTFKNVIDKANILNVVKKNTPEKTKETDITKIDISNQPPPEINENRAFNKEDASRLALNFAERFGSYSNQVNFKNITDLKLYMTISMQDWADNYLAQQRSAAKDTSEYYGITTKAVAKEIKEFDDQQGRAVVLVKTIRQEASGNTDNFSDSFNQDITITIIKEGDVWKVDRAIWEN